MKQAYGYWQDQQNFVLPAVDKFFLREMVKIDDPCSKSRDLPAIAALGVDKAATVGKKNAIEAGGLDKTAIGFDKTAPAVGQP